MLNLPDGAKGRIAPRVLSVRTAAALALGFVGALATALTAAVVGEVAGRRLETQVGQEVASTAAFMAQELDRGMFARWRDLQMLALLDQVRLGSSGQEQRRRVLEGLQATLPDYAWLGITDAQGRVQVATGGLLVGQDVSARPWFQKALQGPAVQDLHEAKLLAPLLGQDGEPPRFVDVATPLFDDEGQLTGVLGAHLYWSWAADVERALRRALPEGVNRAEILVVSQDGEVLLGPPEELGGHVTVAPERGWRLENEGIDERIIGTAATRGYLAYPGLGWSVVVSRAAHEALAPVAALRRDVLLWGLGLSLALAGLAWVLAHTLTRPLARLADAATALGAGRTPFQLAAGPREVRAVGQGLSDAAHELARRAAELERSEGFLRSVLDASTDCIKVVEFDGRVSYLNANGCRALEIDDVAEVEGRQWTSLWSAEIADRLHGALAGAGRGEVTRFRALGPTAKGTLKWWDVVVAPIPGSEGRPLRAVVVSRDVTAEQEVVEREVLLAREVDHRAKNLLAVVQSVVQLTHADSPAAFAEAVGGRIRSLARAHSLLAASRWEGADLGHIIEDELAAYTGQANQRVRVQGPTLKLRPEAAQALALVIHELATNAAKYGALSVPRGTVSLAWDIGANEAGGQLWLCWSERGGLPVEPPTRRGFGSKLIRASIEAQLGGAARPDWRPEGLVYELVLPAERAVLQEARPSTHPRRPQLPQDSSKFQPTHFSGLAGRRVLVVEDEALIAMEIETALLGAGCHVLGPVATIPEALHLLRTTLPDAALLDVQVADERSFGVADRLAAKGVPFVFATGFDAASTLPERFQDSAVVNKPFGAGELIAALERAYEAAAHAQGARPSAAASKSPEPLLDVCLLRDPPPAPS